MIRPIVLACGTEIVEIAIANLLPLKKVSSAIIASGKYQCIAASVREIGIIEPLIVHPQKDADGFYILLDGHIRLHVLHELGRTTVECLIAIDDEAFTYNHKVNRLSPIQEHFMIRRAIKNGVPEKRLAKALHVDVAIIRKKRDLLEGVCPEAVELLKEKPATAGAIQQLRRVRPIRQLEMAELMVATRNFSAEYAKCLLAATPQDQFTHSEQTKEVAGLGADELARIEREMASLEQDFLAIDDSYGRNSLNLVIVVGYLKKLLDSARVVRYLSTNHPEILHEFQKLVESRSLTTSSG